MNWRRVNHFAVKSDMTISKVDQRRHLINELPATTTLLMAEYGKSVT